jgi:SDR family mycofactocin-dependent oxidoreductase
VAFGNRPASDVAVRGRVTGKVALVTGVARGQGRADALRLASEGADIIGVDVCAPNSAIDYELATLDDLAQTADMIESFGRRAIVVQTDVRDLPSLRSVVDDGVAQLGRLDIVVCNAGICLMRPWDQVTSEQFSQIIDVNLIGAWNTVMVAAPHLIDQGSGSIIMISSAAGLKGLPFLVPYVASKHGVTGLARAFAHELAKHNIRVNSLHPTGVDTAMGAGMRHGVEAAMASNPRLAGMFTNSLPIDVVTPEDVANSVLFLASDDSRFVTGMAMTVDAGNTQY